VSHTSSFYLVKGYSIANFGEVVYILRGYTLPKFSIACVDCSFGKFNCTDNQLLLEYVV